MNGFSGETRTRKTPEIEKIKSGRMHFFVNSVRSLLFANKRSNQFQSGKKKVPPYIFKS